jgi:hypothetical protein
MSQRWATDFPVQMRAWDGILAKNGTKGIENLTRF